MKQLFFTLSTALLIGNIGHAAGEHCKRTLTHSGNQYLTVKNLSSRHVFDFFYHTSGSAAEATCKSQFGSSMERDLANSCSGYGGALAEIKVEWVNSSGTVKSLARYSAYCQDLVPEKYICTKWDKVLNKWVSTNDPSCNQNPCPGGSCAP